MGENSTLKANGRRAAVALLAMVTLVTLGATSGFAAPAAPHHGVAATASVSCQALLDGKYPVGSRLEAATSRTCATACGMLADSQRVGRGADPDAVLAARQVCAQSCSFILEEGLQLNAQSKSPIVLAVDACWIVLTTGGNTLPTTDSGGRSWR
ncbi:MAG: hypothetical protein EXQ79_04305 [Acidimicrobiia bacterium]|nr:hypothetical protein [Acidimicrobiia bacterium]